jgi:hypothetical protein
MTIIKSFFTEKFIPFFNKIFIFLKKFFDEKVFNKPKNTIFFTAGLISIVLLIFQLIIMIVNDSVYNNNSDDILQYYVILDGFIRSIKEGSLSFFALNNYFGASIFSNLYYVPLDIFTLVTLILSFIMPTVLAVSTTELIKIVAGVVLFGIYLALKKYSNRTIFWVGLLYFVNGGTASFMNFPAFLTMTVYLPLALIVIHYFFNQKYWVVPLYVVLIVFYNFYLAYMLLAFISFAFLIEYFKFHQFDVKKFLLNGIGFLSLLLLGVLMSSVVLLPAITFISEETIRTSVTFEPWVLDLKFIELKLYEPEVYYRYFAKMFSPQRPVSFRGFLNDYKLEHVSNYVTVIGFMLMIVVFFMKDKIARVYQVMFGVLVVFTIFPFFSSILSGTFIMEMFSSSGDPAYPYNRWLNVVPILQVLVIAHVVETYRFKNFNRWILLTAGAFVLAFGIFMVVLYQVKLNGDHGLKEFVVENLQYDRLLMMILLGLLVVAIILIIFKFFQWIKLLIFLEVAIAVAYIFISAFGSQGRLSQFDEMEQMNEFLIDHIEEEDFSRVYVDLDYFNVINRNFNQMTSFPTNSKVFHSWSDSETDDLGYLLFGKNERQSKHVMDYYSYYLNAFLGYQYILVDPIDQSLINSEFYQLIDSNDDFALYKINSVDSFYVYDQYLTYTELRSFVNQTSTERIEAERLFLHSVIIDESRYDITDYDLKPLATSDLGMDILTGDVEASWEERSVGTIIRNSFSDPSVQAEYFVYEDFGIEYNSGAVFIKDQAGYLTNNFGEIYYLNENEEEIACKVKDATSEIECGQFFSPVEKIYIEKISGISAPRLEVRLERAIAGQSYLVYDISSIMSTSSDLFINLDLPRTYEIDKAYIADANNEEYYFTNGFLYSIEDFSKAYIYKNYDLYQEADLYNLDLEYEIFESDTADFSFDQDLVENKSLVVNGGRISLSYDYISPSNGQQIVVVPVTYSDDWEFTSDEKYDKISVSGGFLGLVIPEGTEEVNITMKFVPKNIRLGLTITLASSFIFTGLILYPIIQNKLRRSEKNVESQTDRTSL